MEVKKHSFGVRVVEKWNSIATEKTKELLDVHMLKRKLK
jgi:hypothetical protein